MNEKRVPKPLKMTGISLTAALIASMIGPHAISSAAEPAQAPAQPSAAVTAGVPAEWDAPEPSSDAPAAAVLSGVKKKDKPTLVAVYDIDGKPVVEKTERS